MEQQALSEQNDKSDVEAHTVYVSYCEKVKRETLN